MVADVILKAGPFFGVNAEPEAVMLKRELEKRGFPWARWYKHKNWIVMEAWRQLPEDPMPESPSTEFLEALCNDELPNWTSKDGYRVPEAPKAGNYGQD